MVDCILLEDFQRINPDLEMKVHSDDLDNTGIGPVSIYYPADESGYTKIDEHLVMTRPNGTRWISTLPLWSGDGTGQEAVLTITGPGTAEFTSYRQEDGQGRYILPAEGDTRSLPEMWTVPLEEGQYYWLYTTYSYGVDNLVVLMDGYLFTVEVRQDDEVQYPRPTRHWFWSGDVDSIDGISYEISDIEYSEEQYQQVDLEMFPETIVPGVLADVTILRDGGYEFRGFVSGRNSKQADQLVQEYLDTFPRYLPGVNPREEDQGWDQPEEDQDRDLSHWEDDLTWKEQIQEAWWKFRADVRRFKNRFQNAYLDWRYGKPIPLPDHHGRKKYRPGQPGKVVHPSRR